MDYIIGIAKSPAQWLTVPLIMKRWTINGFSLQLKRIFYLSSSLHQPIIKQETCCELSMTVQLCRLHIYTCTGCQLLLFWYYGDMVVVLVVVILLADDFFARLGYSRALNYLPGDGHCQLLIAVQIDSGGSILPLLCGSGCC